MVPWLLKQQHATQCSTMQHHATSCNNNRNTWAALRFACYGSSPHMPKIDPGCNYPQGFGIGVLYMQMAIHLCRLYKNHCRQKFACAILYKVARSQHVSLASLAPVQNISKYYRILQNITEWVLRSCRSTCIFMYFLTLISRDATDYQHIKIRQALGTMQIIIASKHGKF